MSRDSSLIHLDLVIVQESLRHWRLKIAKLIFPLLSFLFCFEESSCGAFFKSLILEVVSLLLLVLERNVRLLQVERNALVVEKRNSVTCHRVLMLALRGRRHEEA